MKTTFEHFKSIFQGNRELHKLIEFLTMNYIAESKAITDNPIQDGYNVCFIACNYSLLQMCRGVLNKKN